ncbi:MAG: tetratricopeptide repeat protein [Akkermansiaceae bacterium]
MSEKSSQSAPQAPSPIGEISQEPSAFEAFLDANQKKLIILGIVAIIGLVTYVVIDGLGTIADKNASADVAAARTVPEYEEAAKKHADRNAGGSALMLKAQLQWRDQQKQEAIKTLEGMIEAFPEHPALDSAHSTLASYQQQENNLEEAKKHYEAATTLEGPTSSLALLALGDIARQSGDAEKAKEIYNSVISKYSTSHPQVKSLAEQRLEIVGVAAPGEAKPEPPAPTPGAPNGAGLNPANPLSLPGNTPPTGLTPVPAPKPGATETPAPAPTETPEVDPGKPAEPETPAETPAEEPSEAGESNSGTDAPETLEEPAPTEETSPAANEESNEGN